ncbi:hypothetical protein ACHAXT_002968 [Thalassiosira profunda]
MVHEKRWEEIQDIIRRDPRVSMRVDDSMEEDRRIAMAGFSAAFVEEALTLRKNSADASASEEQEPNTSSSRPTEDVAPTAPELPLRYWVNNNSNQAESHSHAQIRQKRTLLHSLCRMSLPSTELMGAVKTARMLIDASHNSRRPGDGMPKPCSDCECFVVQGVEPYQEDDSDDGQIQREENVDMVQHTSVLTMTDGNGETPLHSMTGAGSCPSELVRVFIDACRPPGDPKGLLERRPTCRDLLVAKNCSQCTPVHFLAVDGDNEEALKMLLRQVPTDDGSVHPTMISDNEGDLPLHFAACNGGSPSLLRTLTSALGDMRSATARNVKGQLAIDELIEWFSTSLQEICKVRNERWEAEWDAEHEGEAEIESDSDEESEYDDDSINGESSSAASGNAVIEKDFEHLIIDRGIRWMRGGGLDSLVSGSFGFVSVEEDRWDIDLWNSTNVWGKMFVLIQEAAAAASIGYSARAQMSAYPVHATVIATKHANYPALALVASVVQTRKNERKDKEPAMPYRGALYAIGEGCSALSKRDSSGKVPLHWACSDIPIASKGPNEADYSPTKSLQARWNTYDHLPYTMIEYLLLCEPSAAQIRTRDGRLPLHLLVEGTSTARRNGCVHPWDDVETLLHLYPESLAIRDPVSGLYPFQLAAASPPASFDGTKEECYESESDLLLSLEITYRLIKEDPALLCSTIRGVQ